MPGLFFRASHLTPGDWPGPQNPSPAPLSLQVQAKKGSDALTQGSGVRVLVCKGLPLDLCSLLLAEELVRGKQGTITFTNSGRMARPWRPPPSPGSTPGRMPGLKPRAEDRQEWGAARASLSLGRTSPQIPGPGRSPGKEEGGSRGGPAGAGHPPPFSASRGAPTIQTGAPDDHGLEGGWARQQKPHDLLPPWHIPCRPDQFPQGLLPTLPLTADLLWVGLLGRPGAVPWGGFSPGLGWCLAPHPLGRGGPQPSQAGAARETRTRILTPNRRAKGPGGPRRGGSATVPTGTPAREDTSGAVGGPGEPAHRLARARRRGGSTPAERLPAARPARGGGGRTPGGSRDRGAGAGRGWAGPPPRLLEPGGRPRDQARGSGEALHACNLSPSSEWSGPLQQPRPGSRRLRARRYVINK